MDTFAIVWKEKIFKGCSADFWVAFLINHMVEKQKQLVF
jgi:hypothetical protein